MKTSITVWKADLALLSVALIWGVTFLPVKDVLNHTPVFAFLFWRFALALLVLIPWIAKGIPTMDRSLLKAGILLGILYFGAYATQTWSLRTLPSSIVAFLTGLYVVIIPPLLLLFFRRPVAPAALIATVSATAGLWLLSRPDSSEPLSLSGEFWGLACAVLFALHIIYTDRYTRRFDLFTLVGIELLVVLLLSLSGSLLFEERTFDLVWDRRLVGALLATALGATAYALLIQTYMQRFTTPTRTAIIFLIEPVSAAVVGVGLGGESLSTGQIVGAVVILLSILVAELSPNPSSPEKGGANDL